MMNPKIYSLSTVGLLKHYNNDYLFHEKRTDFIGPNGVGKSILADLLQLLFIYDRELIKFGTEDMKQTRFIHTLPLGDGCGYCFLNVLVEPDRFITIGVQISDQERKRLVPFVISNSAELKSERSEMLLYKEQLLLSRDFVIDGIIPEIEDLAESLAVQQNLKLVFFKTKEQVEEYYHFLSEKKILPINLARGNNLKVFAKVIQSFSKAKTLKLSGRDASKNLKEFLLEESEDDVHADFNKKKNDLEKVLKDYSRLNEHIKLLSIKQNRLEALNGKFNSWQNLLMEFKRAKLSNCKIEIERYTNLVNEKSIQATNLLNTKQKLSLLMEKIPDMERRITSSLQVAQQNYKNIYRYVKLGQEAIELSQQLDALRAIVLPRVDASWKGVIKRVDVTLRNVEVFENAVNYARPYLMNYSTLDKLDQVREKQLQMLESSKSMLTVQKVQQEKLLELLAKNSSESLLYWFIQNLPDLNDDQVQTLLYFATLSTKELVDPVNGDRFIEPADFATIQTEKRPGGIWVKLDKIAEFIAYNGDAEMLMDRKGLDAGVKKLNEKVNSELQLVKSKIRALSDIRDGKEYERSLFDYSYAPDICDSSQKGKLMEAVAYILQLPEKIEGLESVYRQKSEQLLELQHNFSLRNDARPEDVEKILEGVQDMWLKRSKKISKYAGIKEGEILSLEKEIRILNNDISGQRNHVLQLEGEFKILMADFQRNFEKQELIFLEQSQDLEILQNKCSESLNAYTRMYVEIVSDFAETKGGKNSEVEYELQHSSFSFAVLERVLLGSKLKTRDDIVPALREANDERTRIADNIRYKMAEVFSKTAKNYKRYKAQIEKIDGFFMNRKKISGKYNFIVRFDPSASIKIEYLEKMANEIRYVAMNGELELFNQSIDGFLEEFFRKMAGLKDRVSISELLDAKTYFSISTSLKDDLGEDISGSTGESYSAIALLAVARLSSQKVDQAGLRFIILEELGSLDNTNFNIFPDIAEEFHYQIITMAPHAFNIGLSQEWYAHHLIKGKGNDKINHYPSSSFFKTKSVSYDLAAYINRLEE